VQYFDDSDWVSESFFLKVLTKNDDSGRHGVLIPRAAYPLFPPLGAEVAAEEWNPRKPITTWWGNGGDWKPQPSSFIH